MWVYNHYTSVPPVCKRYSMGHFTSSPLEITYLSFVIHHDVMDLPMNYKYLEQISVMHPLVKTKKRD